MLFGRRKPGYTTTVDAASDPEQVILELQKAEMAAKKKPKAEVFDIDAASETARRLKETGSMFDGSAAKLGEDVIAAVQKETDARPQSRPRHSPLSKRRLHRTPPKSPSCWIFWPLRRRQRATPTPTSPPSPRRSCPSLPRHRSWRVTFAPARRRRWSHPTPCW